MEHSQAEQAPLSESHFNFDFYFCSLNLFWQVTFPDAYESQPDGSNVFVNEVKRLPGAYYTLKIRAPQGTRLGLLAVDQSVYQLQNERRLTKERVSTT